MESAPVAFGDLLRRLRAAAAISQEELAARSGLSARGISDLERGVRQAPRPETLRLLADALALTTQDRTQLVAAASSQPLRAGARTAAVTLLPAPGPIFGRQEERAALSALLQRPDMRLVTVTGPGGAGKTHLALAVASDLRPHFREGAVFVDLSPITDAALVLPTVGRALVPEHGSGPMPVARVADRLRDAQLLLVLDNCEQVLAAAPEIAHLLAACPHLVILATSRAPLGTREEQEWPLAPLSVPDPGRLPPLADLACDPAVALFVARAQASAPQFSLTAENAMAVAAICQQLDGLPLAIELAAARIKLLTPQELAARLQRRLPLLTGGQRDRPPRQQTLRDTIAWSYDLLSPAEQALYRQLGVFVGGWSAEAAADVAELPADVEILDGLGGLLDQSLIRVDQRGPTSRYAMLETIREFAQDALEAQGESTAARARHAVHFLRLAEEGAASMTSPAQTAWRSRLELEHPNLRAAWDTLAAAGDQALLLRLSHALGYFWFANAHGAEGLQRMRHVLAIEPGPTLARAELLVDAGMLAYSAGEYADAIQWFEEALPSLEEHRAMPALAAAWLLRGTVAEHLGDEDAAESSFLAGLAIAREFDDAPMIGECLPNLSDAAYRRGDLAAAERYALEAQGILHDVGDAYMACMNRGNLAQVALARGDCAGAAALVAEGLDQAEAIASQWNIANFIACAAAIALALGDASEAACLLGAGDAARVASGHPRMPHFALYAQTLRRAQTTLGDDAFQVVWEQGRLLPVAEAMQAARRYAR